jgi:molybdopterin synthase sulfur carrier subunit
MFRGRRLPKVHFTSNLQRYVSCPSLDASGASVGAALDAVFEEVPALRSYLLDDQGRLRRHVNIFVNGDPVQDRVRLSDVLKPDDEVYVFQALSGG